MNNNLPEEIAKQMVASATSTPSVAEQINKLKDGTASPLLGYPKASCRKCHGQGYVGTNSVTKQKIACTCVVKNTPKTLRLRRKLTNAF